MRIVSISNDLIDLYSANDREFMAKHGRPCIVMVNLIFRGNRYSFGVPFRSNISPSTPKNQYFALPPRPTTKPKFRHGIHYIKMFPIKKTDQRIFRVSGNLYYEKVTRIINANEKTIVDDCKRYLAEYEKSGRPMFATDLDKLINLLD